jgi:hypothetical protein
MTSTEQFTDAYSAAANGAKNAVERSTELWKQSTQSLTEQSDQWFQLPQLDAVADATAKYFDYLQDGLQVNKDIAVKWFGAWSSIAGAVRDQWQTVADFQQGHSKAISTWISSEAETFEGAAQQQAEQVEQAQREQIERAQQAERDREEKVRQAERDKAKAERDEARRARQEARQRYQELSKAELADQLSDRGLPKTGTVDELIDRLVSADTN